ncbi:NHLP bacteriocin system secretion protein [Methylobacterium sp. sgz302541]|uniref:NHLP bacteriocin system secretion protein n=1 Tax=unclassified Methylobacterium TaxID=2615210 RepID=UPI003D327D35
MARSQEQVFRAVAIERASSPEQLDHLVRIIRPFDWIMICVIFLLLGTLLAWGVLGQIPTRAPAEGILVRSGERIVDAVSATTGRLASVDVAIDDRVTKGQPIARVVRTDAEQNLKSARDILAEREREHADRVAQVKAELAAKARNFAKLEEAFQQVVKAADQRIAYLTQDVENLSMLMGKGYVTRRTVEDRRQELTGTDQRRKDAQNEILKLRTTQTDLETQRERENRESEERRNEARRQVARLADELGQNTQVLSPIDGQVVEVKIAPGSVLSVGTPVAAIQAGGTVLEAVVYIPTDRGKSVKPGMEVRLEPSTVKREEFGTMIGTILRVSEFPVTPQGMSAVLQNDSLVRQFTGSGAPYAAVARLAVDENAVSGYRWAVGSGPPIHLTSGTLVKGEITTRSQRPLDLVLPLMRRLSGILD